MAHLRGEQPEKLSLIYFLLDGEVPADYLGYPAIPNDGWCDGLLWKAIQNHWQNTLRHANAMQPMIKWSRNDEALAEQVRQLRIEEMYWSWGQ